MANIVFVRATPLRNVRARVGYAKSSRKQEHLMAYSDNMPRGGWRKLALYSHQQSELYNPGEKVCEARELIYQLPNELSEEEASWLATNLRNDFSKEYKVLCAVAIHWNTAENNYHAHLIFSEREIYEEVRGESVATRNTYFNEQGKRSTKKECLDENGELKAGCRLVKKGELLSEGSIFSAKKNCFAQEEWLRDEKQRMANFYNDRLNVKDWQVYDWKSNPHFPLIRINREDPASLVAWKERENEWRKQYNATVDELLKKDEITLEQALKLKFKADEERKRLRRERAKNKKLWIEVWQQRKDRFSAEKEYFYRLRQKSLFGLLVELALVTAGVDVVKLATGVEEPSVTTGGTIKAYNDPKIQGMVDAMCIAAGKEPPGLSRLRNHLAKLERRINEVDSIYEKVEISRKIDNLRKELKNGTLAREVEKNSMKSIIEF